MELRASVIPFLSIVKALSAVYLTISSIHFDFSSIFDRASHSASLYYVYKNEMHLSSLQSEIGKRLNTIIAQILPFLSQEHQQQVATAVDRAKQLSISELTTLAGVSV